MMPPITITPRYASDAEYRATRRRCLMLMLRLLFAIIAIPRAMLRAHCYACLVTCRRLCFFDILLHAAVLPCYFSPYADLPFCALLPCLPLRHTPRLRLLRAITMLV